MLINRRIFSVQRAVRSKMVLRSVLLRLAVSNTSIDFQLLKVLFLTVFIQNHVFILGYFHFLQVLLQAFDFVLQLS